MATHVQNCNMMIVTLMSSLGQEECGQQKMDEHRMNPLLGPSFSYRSLSRVAETQKH
jgi:hypothetical protein